MTRARTSHSHTTAIAAGAGARVDGGRNQWPPHMGVGAAPMSAKGRPEREYRSAQREVVPMSASLNRRGISR